ncbi:MAG: tetratricopeptide repeat protein [Desulfobacterium sp.]|nr:tetratricopeptide repeat protein [Desulfobacterium sp.]
MDKTQKDSSPSANVDSFNRASQFYSNRDFSNAIKECESILANDTNNINVLNLLGQINFQTQNHQKALDYYGKVLSIDPAYAVTLNNAGRVFEALGNYLKALEFYQKAAELHPEIPEILVNIGNTNAALNNDQQAISYYKQALKIRPNYAEVHSNLGNLYFQKQGDIGNAIKHCKKAIKINPKLAEAHNNLGNALKHQGHLDQAIQYYKKAIKLKPDYSCANSNLLLGIHYSDSISPKEVFNEHKNYAQNQCASVSPDAHTDHDRSVNRILRIGYISPDFRAHPVAWFIESVIAEHDRSHFKVFCYSDVITPDLLTEKFNKISDCFQTIKGFSHTDVASLIKNDQIDILVDLAGHTANNRIPMLALKPAPIQITYLGYPGTTGLDSVDYRLTDHFADPKGMTEQYHTEKLIRMPRSFLCYTSPEFSPGSTEPLSKRSGKITFGSFNNRSKITKTVIATWAEILKKVPGSTLFLKAKSLADPETQRLMIKLFKKHKISHKQLYFSGFLPDAADHMLLYNKVDIALDTFPYNGTTTTCEALWMGVPVVTVQGKTHASRVGTSILSNTGLEELIAKDRNDYIKKACALANAPHQLAQLKSELRNRVKESGFIDARRFTRELEQNLSTAWQKWCNSIQKVGDTNYTLDHNGPDELLKQGEAYFQNGEMELAEQHFQKAVLKDPNLVDAYNNLGVICWQKRNLEESIAHFKKALTLDPVNQDAIANLKQISHTLENELQVKNGQESPPHISSVQPEQKAASVSKLLVSFVNSVPSLEKSQGGLYLVDLKTNEHKKVIDLNDLHMDLKKGTPARGISGIASHDDQICLVAGDTLFIYDKHFQRIETHQSLYLKDNHGIFASGNRLFITSTGFDAILVFDFLSRKFVEGYHVKYNETVNSIHLLAFDPESEKGPVQKNTIHLNTVSIHDNKLYFSCRNLDRLFCVHENGAMDAVANIPLGTQTARPYKKGFLIPATNGHTLEHLDFNGKVIQSFNVHHHGKTDSITTPAFNYSMGLCIIDDDLIITGASSSTIIAYRSGVNEPVITVNLPMARTSSINALVAWTF